MKRMLIPAMFVFGMLVGIVVTSTVRAQTYPSAAHAAKASLGEAMKHLAQAPLDKAGHLRQAMVLTQQAAIEVDAYLKNPKP